MKMATVDHKFESNIGDVNNFTIEASAKAFKILSSGIYSNNERAIIRELSCNAYDAHVAAGCKDRPFDIVLPNQLLKPYFEIRDYGTGMSDDDIKHLNTTYFLSTKIDSNDFIGGLGLGSKSPFSYTDSFTIISYFNGFARSYMAFINEAGNPSITLTSTVETDECNGLKIRVPVKAGDEYKFANEASFVFKTFPVKPNIEGQSIDMDLEFSKEYSDTIKAAQRSNWGSSNFYAVQGNVRYNISSDYIDNELPNIVPGDIYFYFNIGDLGVTASREELAYNEGDTAKNIKDKVDLLRKLVIDEFNSGINNIESTIDRCKFSYKRMADSSINNELWCRFFKPKDTRGRDISHILLSHIIRLNIKNNDDLYSAKDNRGSMSLRIEKCRTNNLSIHDDIAFYVDDEKNFRRKIREYCSENGYRIDRIIVIMGSKSSPESWSRLMLGIDVIRTSELPATKLSYSNRSANKTSDVKVYDVYHNETDKNLSDVKYYLEINRWEFAELPNIYEGDVRKFINLTGYEVFGVKTKNIKKLPKDAINFADIIDNLKLTKKEVKMKVASKVMDKFDGISGAKVFDEYTKSEKKFDALDEDKKWMIDFKFGIMPYPERESLIEAEIDDIKSKNLLIAIFPGVDYFTKEKYNQLIVEELNKGENNE